MVLYPGILEIIPYFPSGWQLYFHVPDFGRGFPGRAGSGFVLLFILFYRMISPRYERRNTMNETNKWVSVWGNAVSVAENRPERYAKDITIRYPIHTPFPVRRYG